MKSMVALSETNASVAEFDINASPTQMLPPSTDHGCCLSCESIEHM